MVARESLAHDINLFLSCLFINPSPRAGKRFWIKAPKYGEQGSRHRRITDPHFSNPKEPSACSHFRSGELYADLYCSDRGEGRHRWSLGKICRSSSDFSLYQAW
jgi:hypothetical protein